MQKAFLLHEAKDAGDYYIIQENGFASVLVGVFFAPSIEEAARMISGELEIRQQETIVWLPTAQFKEVWNGVECDMKTLDNLTDEHPANAADANFDKYIWMSPWGEIPIEIVELLPRRDKRGLAICEVPLIDASRH